MGFAAIFTIITTIAFAGEKGPGVAIDTIRVDALFPFAPDHRATAMMEVLPIPWVNLIASVQEVDCYLLCQSWGVPADQCDEPVSADFNPNAVRVSGGRLDDRDMELFKAILLDPSSYVVPGFGSAKTCIVNYNVGYVLTARTERSDATERVVVSICHSCLVMTIKWRGNLIIADVDYAGDELIELTKRLFPSDAKAGELFGQLHGHYRFPQTHHD